MPTTFAAIATVLIFFLPGLFFQNGMRSWVYVQRPESDLLAVATRVAVSAILVTLVILVVSWLEGDEDLKQLFDEHFEDGPSAWQTVLVVTLPLWFFVGWVVGFVVSRRWLLLRWLPKPENHDKFVAIENLGTAWVRVFRFDDADVVGVADAEYSFGQRGRATAADVLTMREHWTWDEDGNPVHAGGITLRREAISDMRVTKREAGTTPPEDYRATLTETPG